MAEKIMACSYQNPATRRGAIVVAAETSMMKFFETLGWPRLNGSPREIQDSIKSVIRKFEMDKRACRIAIRQTPLSPIYGGDGRNEVMIMVPLDEVQYAESLIYSGSGNNY